MSHHVVGLDIEDMTPKQLRMALRHAANMSSMSHRRKKDSKDDEGDDAEKDNDELVDLHEEKKGDSKPPKVTEDDLPKAVASQLKGKKNGKGDA